jgi:predicted nucleic-acid-binding protein
LDAIAKALVPLLGADGVEVENRESLIQAIELARDKNVDFVDALIAIEATRRGESVCSFDKDFRRLAVKQVVPD